MMIYILPVPIFPQEIYDTLLHFGIKYNNQQSWYDVHNQQNTGIINLNSKRYLTHSALMDLDIQSVLLIDPNHLRDILNNLNANKLI